MSSSWPEPVPGLVIRYSYLWRSEHDRGHEEGVKDRPCAVVLALPGQNIVVLPITHSPPPKEQAALEIPEPIKRRLRLDSERSWVILTEANLFSWPGPDLRPRINGDLSTIAYGLLPRSFFYAIRAEFLRGVRDRTTRLVPRTD
ncbi:hypothetical protein OHD58_09585 [Mesorhizobium sp. ZC-5]|nr:hypothetical protein [Mesorhizobium sp. ZC-5]MCV3240159.1 hypothetical protein [Mesorhizobium sp. ZC-5]